MNRYGARKRAPVPVFIAMTIVLFVFSLSAADSFGLVPYYIDGSSPSLTTSGTEPSRSLALRDLPELGSELEGPATSHEPRATSLPERIAISAIGLDLPVQNPSTRDIETLDEYLKEGPVRYVDSARLGEKGNVTKPLAQET